jgi:hypothetical protein
MPMEKQDDFGTNADGSRSEDYCTYCYQRGRFTEPDLTMRQMIDKSISMTRKMGIPAEQIENAIPNLKRWKNYPRD